MFDKTAAGHPHGRPAQHLLTETDAAEVLSVSPRTLWGLAAAGEIPFVRIGRLKRYARPDLDDFIARHRTQKKRREGEANTPDASKHDQGTNHGQESV